MYYKQPENDTFGDEEEDDLFLSERGCDKIVKSVEGTKFQGLFRRLKDKLVNCEFDDGFKLGNSFNPFEEWTQRQEKMERQKEAVINEIHEKLNHRYEKEDIANVYDFLNDCFEYSHDVSADYLVHQLLMNVKNNKLAEEDAMEVYRIVAKRRYSCEDDNFFKQIYGALGNIKGGAKTDVIPGAKGSFGYEITNPIPINGVFNNRNYLDRLRLESGEKFTWDRIGSTSTPGIEGMIDIYVLKNRQGTTICQLYLSPYQSKTSEKAPEGFYLE